MLALNIKGDVRAIEAHLSGLARQQVPFATAVCLTRTAKFVEQKIREEIKRSFDRPKPYTLNATYVRPATKQRLTAEVNIKDQAFKSTPPIKWLVHQIYGGRRKQMPFERLLVRAGAMPPNTYAVPASGATFDQYGNMKPSEISRMLSDLQARMDPLQNSTATSRRRRMRSRKALPVFYFSSWPQTAKTQHLVPGIYRRTHLGHGSAIRPVIIFSDTARYRRRLRFFETADAVARMRWPIEFALAMRHALATAR